METQKIVTNTFYSSFVELKKIIEKRKVDLGVRHLIFTPDKYTLKTEQFLFSGGGALDVEVLTFNRLFSRLFKNRNLNFLPKEGGVMLVKKILDENANNLECFFRSAKKVGFAEKLYETINQLLASNIDAEALKARGKKFKDIALILEKYVLATFGVALDSSGKMQLMCGSLELKNYLSNCKLYFINFDFFTPLAEMLTQNMCENALSAIIFQTRFDSDFKRVTLFEANSGVGQLKAVASRISDFVFNGGRYGDVAVAANDICFEEAKRIFDEFNIPFYLDNPRPLSSHPIILFVERLAKATERLRRTQIIALSKSRYLGVSVSDSCYFENFVNRYCVDYLGFYKSFDKNNNEKETEADALEKDGAERVRRAVVNVINNFGKPLLAVKTAAEFRSVILSLFEFLNVEKIEESLQNNETLLRVSSTSSPLKALEKIKANLDLLVEILTGEQKFSELNAVFVSGLASLFVSNVPLKTETVIIGAPSIFRGGSFSRLFVVGAVEGKMPSLTGDNGLISDREIADSRRDGINISPMISEVNSRGLNEFLSIVADSSEVFISFNGSEGRPSAALGIIAERAEKYFESSETLERESLYRETNLDRIARHAATKTNAAELLIESNLSLLPLPFSSEIQAAIGEDSLKSTAQKQPQETLFSSDIFFRKDTSAISRLQEFYLCPYRHFLDFGLGLQEQKDGSLAPLDIGSILHKIIEVFVNNLDNMRSRGDIVALVDIIVDSDPKCRLEANVAVSRRLKTEGVKIAEIVMAQMRSGSAKNFGTEIRFGKEEKDRLKGITIGKNGFNLTLSGTMDRVDILENSSEAKNKMAVVIDYKTGRDRFNFRELYFGKKLQLPLYLLTLNNNEFDMGGMFYFPFRISWSDTEKSHRLSGVFLKEWNVFTSIDSALSNPLASSDVISAITLTSVNKRGETTLKKGDSALEKKQLQDVVNYAKTLADNAVDLMRKGVISRSVLTKGDSCGYCPFKRVCGDQHIKFRNEGCYDAKLVKKFLVGESVEKSEGKE